MEDLTTYGLLCVAAALGGAINAVAGGGTLLTFPALYTALAGPLGAAASVVANATSTVALMPASLSAAWGYRRELVEVQRWLYYLAPPSFAGGLVGSLLVIALPPETFERLVPWLILVATLLLALQPRIASWLGIGHVHAEPKRSMVAGVVSFQLLVGIYGGYFGAGIGILMLSSLAFMGLSDIHRMNALKTILAAIINGISVVVFIASGRVYWPFALAMLVAAVAGGYVAARVARSLDRTLVRRGVVAIGLGLASYYFYGQWRG